MPKDHSLPGEATGDAPSRTMDSLPDLDPVSYGTWKRRVEESLDGRSFDSKLTYTSPEGLTFEPLYCADNAAAVPPSVPGVSPFLAGERTHGSASAPWLIAQEYDDPRRQAAAEAIAQDREQGLQLAWLRFDRQVRSSFTYEGAGGGGLRVTKPRHFDHLLGTDGERGLHLVLDGGAAAPIVLALWLESARRRGVPWQELRGCAGCDPLGALAADGRLAMPLDDSWGQLVDLSLWCTEHVPGLRPLLVSTVAHHEAGATAVDEIAAALAVGAAYVKRLEAAGLPLATAARQLVFAFAVGDDLFFEIAKLRAARWLWARLLAALHVAPEARAMRIHARTSRRSATVRDPWINLLRGTGQSFAAAAAGVWSLCARPFDSAVGQPQSQGRRLAINCHHILAEEAHLGRVVDPAAGSWYIESMTDELARAAWQRFRALEDDGGIELELLSGRLAARYRRAADVLRQDVAQGRRPLVGVSAFPQLDEELLQRRQASAPAVEIDESSFPPGMTAARLEELAVAAESVEQRDGRLTAATLAAVADGASAIDVAQLLVGEGPVSCRPLQAVRLAQPFEELRAAGDHWKEQRGRRPTVQLIHLGPLAEHGPRASFLRQLFATCGIETVSSSPCMDLDGVVAAFAGESVDGAVLCGSDGRYQEFLPHVAPALKGAGARWLFLGGRPGEDERTWAQAGIDTFLFQGCDPLKSLEAFLGDLGVFS